VWSKDAVEQFVKLITIADVIADDISYAFASDMSDFEDAVVAAVAKRIKAEYIVTRSISDFTKSPVSAIKPNDFLKMECNAN
jgi:nucleoside phosphorylase